MKKALLILAILLVSCAKHKDFPNPVDVDEPPLPMNFTVEMPDSFTYKLNWSVSDSISVSYYNIYLFDQFYGPQLVTTTNLTNYQQSYFPLYVVGLVWGVSSVSIDNIESRIVYGFVH